MSWSVSQLAYLAGIVDGEGTITIAHSAESAYGYPYYNGYFTVSNCDASLMLWLKDNFGGSVHPTRYGETKRRDSYRWCAGERRAAPLVEALLPYLIVKKAQAELFLEFRKTKDAKPTGTRTPENVIEMRRSLVKRIQHLNRKGQRSMAVNEE